MSSVVESITSEYTKNAEKPRLNEPKHATKKLINNNYIIKLQKCGFNKIAEEVLHCGDYLTFSLQEHIMTSEQRRRLKRANMCKNRFCSYCNWRRSLNLTDELRRALEHIKKQRQIEILFLTLTAKNEPIERLRETIKYMNNAFHKMQRTKRFKSSILGYIKAIEVLGSKTPSGQSHVHFHCLLVVPSYYFKTKYYIKHSEWVEMWQKALRVDYTPIVDVRRIKAKGNWSAEKSASKETIKYSIKHTDLTSRTDEDFTHIINQTKGMRFISTGGILKEMINLQRIEDAKIKQEPDPYWYEIAEEIYQWMNGDYRLKEIKPPQKKEES